MSELMVRLKDMLDTVEEARDALIACGHNIAADILIHKFSYEMTIFSATLIDKKKIRPYFCGKPNEGGKE